MHQAYTITINPYISFKLTFRFKLVTEILALRQEPVKGKETLRDQTFLIVFFFVFCFLQIYQ